MYQTAPMPDANPREKAMLKALQVIATGRVTHNSNVRLTRDEARELARTALIEAGYSWPQPVNVRNGVSETAADKRVQSALDARIKGAAEAVG